jgi:CheY-like chemotaxis protein
VLGQGSAFQIYLPRVEAVLDSADPEASLPALPTGTETVLVVEDEETVRTLVCQSLRQQGYTVLEAARPAEALRLCETHASSIHLILSDVMMPEMTGWTLVDQARVLCPEAKVLYMSGYAADTIGRQGMPAPGMILIAKPFSPSELALKVRQTLDGD